MAEYANELGYKRIGIMTSGDLQYLKSMTDSATKRTKELGGEVIATESAKVSAPQFRVQASALARANPDVVITSFFLPISNPFFQNLRAAGYTGPVFASDGMGNDQTFAIGEAAKDVYTFNHASFGPEAPESVKTFLEVYEKAHNEPPADALAAIGGDAALLVEAAVTKANSTDPEAIRAAFDELRDVQGVTGKITYAGRNGVPKKEIYLLKADPSTKKWEFIKKFYPESVE
jgi:branched-chain amino acid transport system substrate-binding protein